MNRVVVMDGVRYLKHSYRDEAELEAFVWQHAEVIFGAGVVTIPKTKIRTGGSKATIPDGFVLNLEEHEWYVVEVELSTHQVYEHIVVQLSKILSATEQHSTRKQLTELFYEALKEQSDFEQRVRASGIRDVHKALSEIVEGEPTVVVVIDAVTPDVREACGRVNPEPRLLEFETYDREGTGGAVRLHLVDVLREPSPLVREDTRVIAPPSAEHLTLRASEPAYTNRTGKASRVSLGELASAGLIADRQVLYLCDRQRQRVHQESAVVRVDRDRLEYGQGRFERMSPLALELLKKHRIVGQSLKAIQGPLHWMTKDGMTIDDLNQRVRRQAR